jgi:hypothetical protein
MCNSAAHAVDRVLPAVPVRKEVLSLPFELRRAAAFRADVATAGYAVRSTRLKSRTIPKRWAALSA